MIVSCTYMILSCTYKIDISFYLILFGTNTLPYHIDDGLFRFAK